MLANMYVTCGPALIVLKCKVVLTAVILFHFGGMATAITAKPTPDCV